jgi:hypothetical protein
MHTMCCTRQMVKQHSGAGIALLYTRPHSHTHTCPPDREMQAKQLNPQRHVQNNPSSTQCDHSTQTCPDPAQPTAPDPAVTMTHCVACQRTPNRTLKKPDRKPPTPCDAHVVATVPGTTLQHVGNTTCDRTQVHCQHAHRDAPHLDRTV